MARDADDLAAKLAAATARIEAGQPLAPRGQVHYAAGPPAPGLLGFLFPGQGAQYVGMGADLAVHLPLARAAWDGAARQELGDLPLHHVVFPPPAFSDRGRAEADELLTATEWAQPALAVHSMALLAVLARLGLKPDCVAGHSFGELVALHAAGAFDADTLIRLARSRGELMRDAAAVPGAMLAVTASRDRAEAAVAGLPDVWLANHNAPAQVVLAGTPQALDSVAASLAAEGITTVRLKAATGFHSPLVAPAAGPFADVLRQAGIQAPALDVYAGRDAHVYPPDPAEVRRGLAAQIAAPVQFVDVIEAMYARGVRTFAEVGAGHGAVRPGRPDPRRARARRGQPRPQAAARRHQPSGGTRATVRPRDLPRLRRALGGVRASRGQPGGGAQQGGGHDRRRQLRPALPACGRVGRAAAAQPPGKCTGTRTRRHPPGARQHAGPAIEPGLAGPPQPSPQPSAQPSGVPAGNGQAPGWLAAPGPASLPAAPAPAAPGNGAQEWLGVIGAAQEQAAQAHAEFQRAMTESHLAYLRMAEVTFAGLLSAAAGEAPPAPLPPVALPQVPLPQIPPQASAIWPAAPAGPEVAAAAGPAAGSPPGPAAGGLAARPRRPPGRGQRWCPAAGGGRGADRLSR